MVWRAAVLGEARILLRGAAAFCSGAPLAAGSLAGPRLSAGFWDPLDWALDHFYSLYASRFAN